jgi:hypothetical protein
LIETTQYWGNISVTDISKIFLFLYCMAVKKIHLCVICDIISRVLVKAKNFVLLN